MTFARVANQLFDDYRDLGLEFVFVVSDQPSGAPATAAYCEDVRDEFGLTMRVVMDPETRIGTLYGANDLTMVVDEGATILFSRRYATVPDLRDAIEGALDD